MPGPGLLVLLSFVVLFLGAEFLVRGAAALARRLGLSPLVIGLTVVAYGTSTPELLVSLKAAIAGQSDLAVGNVVGSNVFNIAVILGLAALVSPIRSHLQVLKWDAPVLLAVTLLTPLLFLDDLVSRPEGGLLVLGAAGLTAWSVRLARRDETPDLDPSGPPAGSAAITVTVAVDDAVPRDLNPKPKPKPNPGLPGLLRQLATIAIGLGLLVVGSRLLVDNSVAIARSLGVSEAVIGLTIVAAGTSTPELATSLVAALRRQSDIALGNVLGSNLFNLLFVLGGSALVHPVATTGLSRLDLGMMIGVTALLVPFLVTGKRLSRAEGLVLLLAFAAYLVARWP